MAIRLLFVSLLNQAKKCPLTRPCYWKISFSCTLVVFCHAQGLHVWCWLLVRFSPFICIFIDFGGDVSTAADEQTKLFRYWLIQEQLVLVIKLYEQSPFQVSSQQ